MAAQVNDLMCDFETLGTSPDSVLLSGGLVLFNRKTGEVLEEHYQEYSLPIQVYDGRIVDPKTLGWWKGQNPGELNRLLLNTKGMDPSTSLPWLLKKIGKYKYIWSRGCMDMHILSYHMGHLPYYIHRDVRTLDVFGIKMKENAHNALEDCRVQVAYVVEVLGKWNARDVEESSGQMESALTASVLTSPMS